MTETIFKLMKHNTEFRFRTETFPDGKVKHDICKVVNGEDCRIKDVVNFREASEYLETGFKKDWDRFTLFADSLHDAIREAFDTFDFEPLSEIETQENITVMWGLEQVNVKLWLIVKCEYEDIDSITLDHIDIYNAEAEELSEMFVLDLDSIITQAFAVEIA